MKKRARGVFNVNVGVESYPVDDYAHKSVLWVRYFLHYFNCVSCSKTQDVALYRKADHSLVTNETIKKHTIDQLKQLVEHCEARCKKCVEAEKWHLGKYKARGRSRRIPQAIEEADLHLLVVTSEHFGETGETVELRGDLLSISKMRLMQSLKAENCCPYCGEDDPNALDFHHIDRNLKYKSVSEMAHDSSDLRSFIAEIEKTTILCASCHRKFHNTPGFAVELEPFQLFVRSKTS